MKNTLTNILNFIISKNQVSYTEIKKNFFDINESTIIRNLNKLITNGQILKEKIGKNTFYKLIGIDYIKNFFDIPFFERAPKKYNFDFLKNYIPNKTSYLEKRKLELKNIFQNTLSTYDYQKNIRGIENLLIDLSFSSSKLEGNTYSYLDTETLIKYNQEAEGKTKFETQMILNHKKAIQYIIENRNKITYSKIELLNIHLLLGKGLLTEDNLGIIRNSQVQIGGSTYTPLDNKFHLEEQFEIFLVKLNKIINPFEQCLFILIYIPYFQLFMDINKRVSRIFSNIPLIKNGLPPFSFLQVNSREYINAILAIYELNDVSLMTNLFVNNYILNIKRYIND